MIYVVNYGTQLSPVQIDTLDSLVALGTTPPGSAITKDGSGNFVNTVISGGGSLDLEVNGTPNGDQTLLNLVAGSNITLTDNGTGSVTIAATSGGGTPGGSDTQLQYNNAGAFGGISGATTNGTVVTLTSPVFATSANGSYLTASEMLITDGSKNIISASVATYPSLTELTYVKGVTSAIQTQLNAKGDVFGPASSSDNAIARFDTTTGKLLQNSSVFVTDGGFLGIGTSNPLRALTIEDATFSSTLMAFYNPNTADGTSNFWSARTDTTGTGAATFQSLATLGFFFDIHNHATRQASMVVQLSKGSGPAVRYKFNYEGLYIGGSAASTALLHLAAGTATAGTAPVKFTSGTLLTTPEVGTIEFLSDKWYGTITTGTERKILAFTKLDVEANTDGSGSPNILTADETGKVLTNEGTTVQNYHTLPTAVAGLTYTFYVDDADGIRITANTGDIIQINGVASSSAGYCESLTIGSSVTLVAINATDWVATSSVGTWNLA